MKRINTELRLPQTLDKKPIPLVSQSTTQNTEGFLISARDSIGYSIDSIGSSKTVSNLPVFDALFVGFAKMSYVEYLANIYHFRLERNHVKEAQEIFSIYQELVMHKHAYAFLRIFAAGDVKILKDLFVYLAELSTTYNSIQTMHQMKYTNQLPSSHFSQIDAPLTLIASFIFSD